MHSSFAATGVKTCPPRGARKRPRRRGRKAWRIAAFLIFLLSASAVAPALFRCGEQSRHPRPEYKSGDAAAFKVTGYCNCGRCCGWKRSWFGFGRPVYAYGPMKGKPKKVGLTSSGKRASKGTVAADTRLFRYGDRLYIPGYGVGRVEDTGGAIRGRHIDVWFPTHKEAVQWGVRRLKVSRVLK